MIEDGSSVLFVHGEREWGEVVKCTCLQVIKFNIDVNLVPCISDVLWSERETALKTLDCKNYTFCFKGL